MKILLDECVTKHLKPHLSGYQVSTVRELGWSGVKNGKLMTLCVENGFDILLTIEDGLIEIKCPNTSTHIDYLLAGVPPSKYIPQMQTQMACTGAKWCDFVSFDPRLPSELQLFVVRLDRDEAYIHDIEVEVQQFLEEVKQIYSQLKARNNGN